MVIIIAIGVLILTFIILCLFGHGYVNTIKWLAWALIRHAQRVEWMHEQSKAVVNGRLAGQIQGMGMEVENG